MNSKHIETLQNRLNVAHQCIQNLIIQATAGNSSNILSAINNIQNVFNELGIIKDELEKQEKKEGQKEKKNG